MARCPRCRSVLPSTIASSNARRPYATYEDEHHYRDWIDLCERLTEFDELMVAWRLRLIQVVERIIGVRRATGHSEWTSYLRVTLSKRLFPERWEARTMLHQLETNPMTRERDAIAIIGSGLTGPLLAISLVQRGFAFRLYELDDQGINKKCTTSTTSISVMDAVEKDTMRQLAMRGGPWSPEEPAALLAYCERDVIALRKLFERMRPKLDIKRALYAGAV